MKCIDLSEIRSKQYYLNEEKYGFSGWNENGVQYETCICCGKPIYNTKPQMLHLFTNGFLNDYEKDLSGTKYEHLEQGWFPIGVDCYKKFLSKAQEKTLEDMEKM